MLNRVVNVLLKLADLQRQIAQVHRDLRRYEDAMFELGMGVAYEIAAGIIRGDGDPDVVLQNTQDILDVLQEERRQLAGTRQ